MSIRAERGTEAALWFAVLGGAGAWVGHLGIGWLLEEVVACGSGTSDRGRILGLDVEVWILGITAVFALIAVAAGVVGYRGWRGRSDGDASPRDGRRAFMGFAGVLGAALSLPIILLGGLQVLTLHPCSP
jgi:hypothetical protein